MGVYFTLNNKSNLLDLPIGVNTVYWLAVKTNIWGYRIMVDYGALIRLRSWFDSTYPYLLNLGKIFPCPFRIVA